MPVAAEDLVEPDRPDTALLEFLGSWDGEDDAWQAMIQAAADEGETESHARQVNTESGDE